MLKVVGREDLAMANAGLHILGIPLEPAVAKDLWAHLDRTFKSNTSDYWCDTLGQAANTARFVD
jgi:hypothetical protein